MNENDNKNYNYLRNKSRTRTKIPLANRNRICIRYNTASDGQTDRWTNRCRQRFISIQTTAFLVQLTVRPFSRDGTGSSGSRVTGSTFWAGSGRVGSRVSVQYTWPGLLTRIRCYKNVLSVYLCAVTVSVFGSSGILQSLCYVVYTCSKRAKYCPLRLQQYSRLRLYGLGRGAKLL